MRDVAVEVEAGAFGIDSLVGGELTFHAWIDKVSQNIERDRMSDFSHIQGQL